MMDDDLTPLNGPEPQANGADGGGGQEPPRGLAPRQGGEVPRPEYGLRRLGAMLLGVAVWFFTNVTSPIVTVTVGIALVYALANRGTVRVLPFDAKDAALALQLERKLDAVAVGAQSGVDPDECLQQAGASELPSVSLPGTSLSVDALLKVFQWGWLRETEVRATLLGGGTDLDRDAHRMYIQVDGPDLSVHVVETEPKPTPEEAYLAGAEALYEVLKPTVAAYYLFQRVPERSLQIVEAVLHDARSSARERASANHVWGLVLRDRGDYDGALAKLGTAVEETNGLRIAGIYPRRRDRIRLARLHVEMGYVHMLQRSWTRAAEAFSKAATADPTWAVPLTLRADALRELGELDQANLLYEQAITIDPNFADPWRGIALVRRARGAEADAVDALVTGRRASLVRTGQAALSYELGDLLWALGCAGDAVREWNRAVALEPAREETRADWQDVQACMAPRQQEAPEPRPCSLG